MRMPERLWPPLSGVVFVALSTVTAVCAIGHVRAGEPGEDSKAQAAREQFFEQNIRPILAQSCYSCHSDKKQKGGLRLDSLAAVLKGGKTGPAVVPGKPDESLLVDAINYAGPEMPPTGKLAPEKVAVLTRWISLGAPWPRDRAAHASTFSSSRLRSTLTAADRAFWSLQSVRKPKLPDLPRSKESVSSDWPRNGIDHFVQRSLLDHGLMPAPEADKLTLIRRATFDLTGLPPTIEELDAFLADDAPDAYERLVDRLLASPRYGQRSASRWLDLVRYAESDGHRQDAFRPQAWRYRDYVVRAFNSDKSYDRFLTEQLAGDELDPNDPEMRVAAGYLRLGTYEYNQRNVRGQWADILNDITDVTGEVFLGLSVGCARCHDHKFDPILQRDYYRLQAFFTPLFPRYDLTTARPQHWIDYQERRASWEKATAEILGRINAIEKPYRDKGTASATAKLPEEIQAILGKPEHDRSPLEQQLGALAYRQISFEHDQVPAQIKGADKARWDELQKELKRFDAMRPVPPDPVLTATDIGPDSPPTRIPGQPDEGSIEPGFPTVLEPAPARIERPVVAPNSTGRRLALARWLSRADNPLSTRVIVNRIWQDHFGRGLVGTSSDFGRLGEPPSHPELLDWLVAEFIAQGWHLKPLHRLILNSSAYRQAAQRTTSDLAEATRVDPENRLLSKRTVRRLDADQIRDAMLAATGELEPVMGGPSARGSQARRTIDTVTVRNTRDAFLDAFDAPDGTATTPRRNTTTTATQALLLINGEWALARATALAARLERRSSDLRDQITLGYRLTIGRAPESDELEQALAFLDRQSRLDANPAGQAPVTIYRRALVDFCHVLLNSNEFMYVD
jgi:Protein of unknown function (DUF1549)/Protein of unknown function (DUF1553)/Planctomycete cytochrome C